ncbi:hypothetical protein LINPERPRIM_LOCUS31458, partial [Linum perenne]
CVLSSDLFETPGKEHIKPYSYYFCRSAPSVCWKPLEKVVGNHRWRSSETIVGGRRKPLLEVVGSHRWRSSEATK